MKPLGSPALDEPRLAGIDLGSAAVQYSNCWSDDEGKTIWHRQMIYPAGVPVVEDGWKYDAAFRVCPALVYSGICPSSEQIGSRMCFLRCVQTFARKCWWALSYTMCIRGMEILGDEFEAHFQFVKKPDNVSSLHIERLKQTVPLDFPKLAYKLL